MTTDRRTFIVGEPVMVRPAYRPQFRATILGPDCFDDERVEVLAYGGGVWHPERTIVFPISSQEYRDEQRDAERC